MCLPEWLYYSHCTTFLLSNSLQWNDFDLKGNEVGKGTCCGYTGRVEGKASRYNKHCTSSWKAQKYFFKKDCTGGYRTQNWSIAPSRDPVLLVKSWSQVTHSHICWLQEPGCQRPVSRWKPRIHKTRGERMEAEKESVLDQSRIQKMLSRHRWTPNH